MGKKGKLAEIRARRKAAQAELEALNQARADREQAAARKAAERAAAKAAPAPAPPPRPEPLPAQPGPLKVQVSKRRLQDPAWCCDPTNAAKLAEAAKAGLLEVTP
jgi:hypothetical protein